MDTFFSDGKKVFMTGRDSRPTRPSCTALDVVLAVKGRGKGDELFVCCVCSLDEQLYKGKGDVRIQ